jgi:hypothetical protein
MKNIDLLTQAERYLSGEPIVKSEVIKSLTRYSANRHGHDEDLWTETNAGHVEDMWRVNGSKIHILFLVHYPLPNVIRQSIALRATGRYTTTLAGYCIREEMRLERYFDLCIECGDHRKMAKLLQKLKPHITQAVNGPGIIPALAVIYSPAPVVVELYDSIIFYWDGFEQLPQYHFERFSTRHAAGVLHKYPKSAHFTLQTHYKLQQPLLQFHTFVSDAFCSEIQTTSPGEGAPRVIYTGGLMPPRRARELGHTNHLFFDLIQQMTAQGIELTIFANQNDRNMRWHRQKPYFDLQNSNRLFRLKTGRPVDKISRVGSRYHFGLFYDNLTTHQFDPIHFKYMTATKFFSYLEMGLPIMIYPESEFLYRLSQRFQICVEYDAKTLGGLKRAIARRDYATLKKNVVSMRHQADIKKYIPTLSMFYQAVLRENTQLPDFDRFFPLEE